MTSMPCRPPAATTDRNRPGFTLTEVLIALVMTGVIGAAVTSVFISQTRFYDRQEKVDFARGVSRSAMNILTSELRMVERDSGVIQATNTRLVLRVPYVLGISCGGSGTTMALRYLPTDTAVLKAETAGEAVYSGFARLRDDGTYRYHDIADGSNIVPALNAGQATCNTAPDTVRAIPAVGSMPAGGTMTLSVPTNHDIAPRGRPVLLYRKVTYEFKASLAVPGRIGLWRRDDRKGGDGEELVAPFTADAGFEFYVNDSNTPTATAPTALRDLTGIRVIMNAASERPDRDGTYPTVPLATSIFFKNRTQ